MNGMDFNYCRVLRESISGERAVDELAMASLAILSERLERVKKLGGSFEDIAFSPAVKKLTRERNAVTV
jgi:hypothetical protein